MYQQILEAPPNQVQAEAPKAVQFTAIPDDPEQLGFKYPIYSKFHTDINAAISEFNAAQDSEAKKVALVKMQQAVDYIEVHLPPHILADANRFYALKQDLFNKMKQAFAENGVSTLLKAGSADTPIARIISDMSPDKTDQLMEILHQGAGDMSDIQNADIQTKLKNLYPLDDLTAEAEQWRVFLKNHDIAFLGGYNSRNYKVTNKEPTDPHFGTVKILKVDNRLGMPRHVEQHLRSALGDVFTPVDAARQVRGKDDKGERFSRTLLVTDLCTSGSVDEHARRTHAKGETEIFRECGNIMGQMAQVLMKIQEAKGAFPDAKLMNWLVDSEGNIRLADSKSFVFTHGGFYSSYVPGNEHVDIIRTSQFAPQEIDSAFNAEKLHAYILGCNIYAYLTYELPSPEGITFEQPIFKTKVGELYKELIEQLTQQQPQNRPNINDAYMQLIVLTGVIEFLEVAHKANQLSDELNMSVREFADNMIDPEKFTDLNQVKITKNIINNALDEVQKSLDKCKQLMQEINNIAANNNPPITMEELQEARNQMIHDATSLSDLKTKIDTFCVALDQAKATLIDEMKPKPVEAAAPAPGEEVNAFKEFQAKYKEQVRQRDDVDVAQEQHIVPKH